MKTKLFLSFLIFMMGIGSLYAKTENDPRYRLEKAFEWYLAPGTDKQKEYAMQNPGEWVMIERQIKSIFQRNQDGIMVDRKIILVRLICYDEEEQRFLCEERVVRLKDDATLAWTLPIVFLIFSPGIFIAITFDDPEIKYGKIIWIILICTVSVGSAWLLNWIIMWWEIIVLAFILFTIGLKYLVKSIKKKKEIKN